MKFVIGERAMEMRLDKIKLKQLRESKAWSQAHLAEISGISLRTIQRIEKSGIASPESVKSLCATFDIQIRDLIQGSETGKNTETFFPNFINFQVSKLDIKMTIASFVIAFVIAYLLAI